MSEDTQTRWRDHGVNVIPSAKLDFNTPQTPGMTRAAAITHARMTALVLGQIDATILSYPDIHVARKRGMNVLADIGDFSAYPNTSLLVTRAFVERQRPLAKNLLKSQIEAIHYMRTNRGGSIKILKKYLWVADQEAVDATYDFFSRRADVSPRANLDGIRNILKEMDAAQRNPNDFIDMSLLDEIEKEGFIQRIDKAHSGS